MIRGPSPSYLVLIFVLIGGMLGRLSAASETVEVGVRKKDVEQGESPREPPVDVRLLLAERGPLPISRLPLIGCPDATEIDAGIRPGRRYRMQLASWPWLGERMVMGIYP